MCTSLFYCGKRFRCFCSNEYPLYRVFAVLIHFEPRRAGGIISHDVNLFHGHPALCHRELLLAGRIDLSFIFLRNLPYPSHSTLLYPLGTDSSPIALCAPAVILQYINIMISRFFIVIFLKNIRLFLLNSAALSHLKSPFKFHKLR